MLSESLRCFVALDVSPEALDELTRLQRRLIARVANDCVRWAPIANTHLTLKFLGDVPAAKISAASAALRNACAAQPAVRLSLGSLGAFPNLKKPSVIWLGVNGELDALHALFGKVEMELQPFAEKPQSEEYHPHLTLGRVKPNLRSRARWLGEKLQHEILQGETAWVADHVSLYRSDLTPKGSIYTQLARVDLSK